MKLCKFSNQNRVRTQPRTAQRANLRCRFHLYPVALLAVGLRGSKTGLGYGPWKFFHLFVAWIMSISLRATNSPPWPLNGHQPQIAATTPSKISSKSRSKFRSMSRSKAAIFLCHFRTCLSRMQKCRNIYVPLRISNNNNIENENNNNDNSSCRCRALHIAQNEGDTDWGDGEGRAGRSNVFFIEWNGVSGVDS